jgi:hypothetical protein
VNQLLAAIALILAFLAVMAAVLYFAEWLLVRFEAWALARGLMELVELE